MPGELVFAHAGFGADAVPYPDGWELQRRLHDRRAADQIPDTCLLLEHEPVYTAGRRTEPLDRPLTDPGIPVIDVDRGGKITWHGPGQLVGYPIMALAEPLDVIAYVRSLEEALIRCCADVGVATTRVEGRSGVWVTGRRPGPEGRRGRHPGVARGHHARVRAQLRLRPRLVRQDRALRHQGRGRHVADRGGGPPVTVPELTGLAERHLAEVFGAVTWRRVVGVASLLPDAELTPAP